MALLMIPILRENRNYDINYISEVGISTITQVYKQILPIVRNDMTHLFVYRLSNYADLQATIEELSAVYDPKTLLQIYHEAVAEPYSFLYKLATQSTITNYLWRG